MKRGKQMWAGVGPLVLLLALLGCGGGGGGPTEPPSVTITATPSSIIRGQSSTLEWQSENALSVVESNFGATQVSGTMTVSPTSTTTYTITVEGVSKFLGQATQSVTVNVGETELPPTLSLGAAPSTINPGESATLTWTSSNADAVVESNFGATTLSGSLQVSPTVTTTYYIVVSGPGGQARQSATVTVISLAPSISLAADPTSIPADGISTSTLRATVWDINHNPVLDGTVVSFSTTLGTVSPPDAGTVSGVATGSLTSTYTGIATVTAACGTATDSVSVTLTPPVALSPRIAFTSQRDGNNEIYVMNSDGTNQWDLTLNPAWDWSPSWSPDGSKIAFTSNRDGGNWEIYVMNSDGSNQTRLTNNPADDQFPSWSPF